MMKIELLKKLEMPTKSKWFHSDKNKEKIQKGWQHPTSHVLFLIKLAKTWKFGASLSG